MKTIHIITVAMMIYLGLIANSVTVYSQEELLPCVYGQPELGIVVYGMPKPQRDSGLIIMDNISTCWGSSYSTPEKKFLPLDDQDTLCKDTSNLVQTCNLPGINDTFLVLYGEGWDYPARKNVYFTYGKYKFYVGYLKDSAEATSIVKYDSIMIDFTDSNYGLRGACELYPNANDFRIAYYWGTNTWVLYNPIEKTLDWESPMNVIVWDTIFSGPCATTKPRVTNCFTPAPPKDFSLTGGGSIQLSWQSNAESFAIKYMIYRKINSENYNLIDSVSNSSYQGQIHTYTWTDPDIGCTGGNQNTAYYFIRAKNVSGSPYYFSDPTDTLNTNFKCYMAKSTSTINKNDYILNSNYPNPFNPSTEISYQLPADDYVSLKIYNTLGQEVRTLVQQAQSAGLHKVVWDGKSRYGQSVPSGVYLYRLQTASFTKTMKMILMR